MHSDERPTVIDELGHCSASEMMRISRARRDEEEAQRIAALFGEATTRNVVETDP